MPLIQISMRAGRGEPAVRELISAVTQTVSATLQAPPETVRVMVTEVPATHWANGDVTLAEQLARG